MEKTSSNDAEDLLQGLYVWVPRDYMRSGAGYEGASTSRRHDLERAISKLASLTHLGIQELRYGDKNLELIAAEGLARASKSLTHIFHKAKLWWVRRTELGEVKALEEVNLEEWPGEAKFHDWGGWSWL